MVHGELSGLGADDHLQYLRTDGTRNLTGIQQYQSQPTFTSDLDIITKKYVDDYDNLKLNITDFDTFTGTTLPNNYYNKSEINVFVTGYTLLSTFNAFTGVTNTTLAGKQDTITGAASTITTSNLTASRVLVSNTSGKVAVSTVTSTQLGYVAGVTSAIQTQLNSKAPINSPSLTGTPLSPTAVANTSTTQIATTAYVVGQAATSNPLMDGTVAIGTSLRYARQDHKHPSDTSKLDIVGGTITGDLRINQSLYVTGTTATPSELQNAVLLGAITSDGRIVATSTPALNVSESITDVTGNTLVTEISGIYYVDTTSGDINLTIPNASSDNDAKKMGIIMKAGTNNVIITTVGGTQNIGNQTTQVISQIDKGLTVVADNDNSKWIVTQDSRYVEGQTEGELQYWDNTLKVWTSTSNDITWDNTNLQFTVGGNSTPSTFKVDATDDIVYINASDLTGLVSGDDLGFYAGGRGAFGNSVTIDRLRANAAGNVPRSLSLIDTNAVMRIWRLVDDTNDPAVEMIWGTDPNPTDSGNAWWDMYLDGANDGSDSFGIRRRTGGNDIKILGIDVNGITTPYDVNVGQKINLSQYTNTSQTDGDLWWTGNELYIRDGATSINLLSPPILNNYVEKVEYGVYTGTTAPNTYLTINDFDVYTGSTIGVSESRKFSVGKLNDQVLSTSQSPITNWNVEETFSNSEFYSWDETLGELTFLKDGYYNINFDISILGTNATSRSEGRSVIQEDIGSGFVDISYTTREFYVRQINYGASTSTNILREYSVGDKIRSTAWEPVGTTTLTVQGNGTSLNVIKSEVGLNTIMYTGSTDQFVEKTDFNTYTGATQTEIDTKQNIITGGASTITTSNLTASRTLVSDASGKVAVSTVTSAQLTEIAARVYGTEYQLTQSAAAASTTSTAFQTKATMTTATLPAGTYKITVAYLWTQTSSEDFFSSQVTVGGTPIGSEHYENVGRQSRNSSAVNGSTWIPTTRVFYQTISGVNTIALQYRQQGGGTASIKNATIELIRVS